MNKDWIGKLLAASYEASEKIIEVYNTDFKVDYKSDHSPVTVADKISSKILVNHLKELEIPIISEEEEIPDYSLRKNYSEVFLVDPLDGTKEFANRTDEFCICIAHIKDQEPNFGLIANPVNKVAIFGGPDFGTYRIAFGEEDFLNDRFRLKLDVPEKMGLVYSRSHFSENVLEFISKIEAKYGDMHVVRKGSALKFFDLVENKAQIYPRLAPTMEWDIAAGHAIYKGIGGDVLDFTNLEPLRYNKESLYNPFFIAKPSSLSI